MYRFRPVEQSTKLSELGVHQKQQGCFLEALKIKKKMHYALRFHIVPAVNF